VEKNDFASICEATWGLTIASIIFAFLSGSLMRFVDPNLLAGIGTLLGLALTTFHSSTAFASKLFYRVSIAIVTVAAVTALFLICIVLEAASKSSEANDARCLAIQQDMLSARPRRSDGPDLFQALGCRPQGKGSVHVLRNRPWAA
jgi:hypothetical protein